MMSTLSFIFLIASLLLVIVVLIRVFGGGGIEPLAISERLAERRKDAGNPSVGMSETNYQEVLNLGDVVLMRSEAVLAACGQRGEIENVLLATNKRVFFFTRRLGASRYHHDIFDYRHMHPIPLGQAVIGERIRIMEGDRMAEMSSPGAESWLDSAEDTIRIINDNIRRARLE